MERAQWLRDMRRKAQEIYDEFSPLYWVRFGFYPDPTHQEVLRRFLARLAPHSALLSAACGAGRYDGVLLEAGHTVVGTDQSAGMLARAREHLPQARYEQVGLQEMDYTPGLRGAHRHDNP